jgi:hypothetical protein
MPKKCRKTAASSPWRTRKEDESQKPSPAAEQGVRVATDAGNAHLGRASANGSRSLPLRRSLSRFQPNDSAVTLARNYLRNGAGVRLWASRFFGQLLGISSFGVIIGGEAEFFTLIHGSLV